MTARTAERRITAYMEGVDRTDAPDNIHTDAGARKMGYDGGLVYGTTVYAWATPLILEVLGERFLSGGWADFFVKRPAYVGDDLTIRLEQQGEDVYSLVALGEDGKSRIEGSVGLGACPTLDDHVRSRRIGIEPTPDPWPRITLEGAPIGEDLPHLESTAQDRLARMFTEATEHEVGPLTVGDRRVLAPAAISGRMTWYVHAVWDYNGPAIHTRSQVEYRGLAGWDEPVSVAGHFLDAFERNGHHHSTTDGIVLGADGREIAITRHGSIFKVAPRTPRS